MTWMWAEFDPGRFVSYLPTFASNWSIDTFACKEDRCELHMFRYQKKISTYARVSGLQNQKILKDLLLNLALTELFITK